MINIPLNLAEQVGMKMILLLKEEKILKVDLTLIVQMRFQ